MIRYFKKYAPPIMGIYGIWLALVVITAMQLDIFSVSYEVSDATLSCTVTEFSENSVQ